MSGRSVFGHWRDRGRLEGNSVFSRWYVIDLDKLARVDCTKPVEVSYRVVGEADTEGVAKELAETLGPTVGKPYRRVTCWSTLYGLGPALYVGDSVRRPSWWDIIGSMKVENDLSFDLATRYFAYLRDADKCKDAVFQAELAKTDPQRYSS